MYITKKRLKHIIESYITEIDHDQVNKEDIEKAREEAGIWSMITGAGGGILQIRQSIRSTLGFDNIEEEILSMALPYHYGALAMFLTVHKGEWVITSRDATTTLHEICKYRHRKVGKNKFLIRYSDYYYSQPKGSRNPTYRYPGNNFNTGFKPYDPGVGNIHGQLSVTLGQATAEKQSDGTFLVHDQYNFNVIRDKHPLSKAVPTLANQYSIFEKIFLGMFGSLKEAGAQIEPMLIQMETSLNYNGYPIKIKTVDPKTPSWWEQTKDYVGL